MAHSDCSVQAADGLASAKLASEARSAADSELQENFECLECGSTFATPAEFRVHDWEAHSDPEASVTAGPESVRARARARRARVAARSRAREREREREENENATWRRRRAEEEAREEFKFSGQVGQPVRVVKMQTQTTKLMIKRLTTKGKGTANRHAQASTSTSVQVIAPVPVPVPAREIKPLPTRARTRKPGPKDLEPARPGKGSRVSQRLVDKKTVTATKKCACGEEEQGNVDPLA
ncbi:hypothetical protein C8F01DRAFT_1307525 [Mycena amicta]|nr:hypothetical protein C8F01DRAFT_1307525 [Mycena amicta]